MADVPAAFGRYACLQRLGVGGMGAVYLARDESLGREVAVKVLRPLVAIGEPPAEMVERFRREARAVAHLTHPNIVRVYDQGVEGDLPYLVMELCAGPTLSDRLKAEGPLPVREARTLGIQMASALGEAHAAGVVHRDVKPSNVLMASTGTWKLADFGIAQTADSSLTITGQFLGTPSYAPPESLDGRPSGPAGDVYSLAATLYAALTGEPPYGDANLAQLAVAVTKRRPPPIGERRGDLPPSVAQAIDRALSLAPDERPAALELARDLAVDRTPVPGTYVAPIAVAPLPHASGAAPAPQASGRKARPLIWIGVALAALIIIALAFGSDRRPQGTALPAAAPVGGGVTTGAPADGRPPWETSLPPELTRERRGKPDALEKHWRKAVEKLQNGEWDKGAEELYQILDRDPGNQTAREWLGWMQAAAVEEHRHEGDVDD